MIERNLDALTDQIYAAMRPHDVKHWAVTSIRARGSWKRVRELLEAYMAGEGFEPPTSGL